MFERSITGTIKGKRMLKTNVIHQPTPFFHMGVDYLYISEVALFPGLILAAFGWLLGTSGVLSSVHVVGFNRYTLKFGIAFNIFWIISRFVFFFTYLC